MSQVPPIIPLRAPHQTPKTPSFTANQHPALSQLTIGMPLTLSWLSRSLLTDSRSCIARVTHSPLPKPSTAYLPSTCKPVSLRTFTHRAFTMAPADTAPVSKDALSANQPIVISGPSGAGKSTILSRLFEEFPGKFGFSISHTTRAPRGTEQNGKEYYFVTKEEFLDLIEKKGFVEHAQFGGNYYGTSIKAVNDIAEKGQICILDIEMEVRNNMPNFRLRHS